MSAEAPPMSAITAEGGGERPVNMRDFEVRAILREIERPGTGKTQHRVPLKKQPDPLAPIGYIHHYVGTRTFDLHTRPRFSRGRFIGSDRMQIVVAPNAVGDRLWVQEALARVGDNDDDFLACPDLRVPAYYRADDVCPEHLRWRSPRHMRRSESRLTLLVTEVRVERLQDISEADAVAEGAYRNSEGEWTMGAGSIWPGTRPDNPIHALKELWAILHGSLDAWFANPWVAAITYRPILANLDALPAESATPTARGTGLSEGSARG